MSIVTMVTVSMIMVVMMMISTVMITGTSFGANRLLLGIMIIIYKK
jgi:hypothetical protein